MNQSNPNPGNLIKNRQRSAAHGVRDSNVVKNQIVNARETAAKIVAEAEYFAENLRREAESQAENLRVQAYQEGTDRALSEFELNLLEIREIREKVWRDAEQDLLRLSVRLAEKILGREIQNDAHAIASIVSTALQNARGLEKLTIRVNPQDLPVVEQELENFKTSGRRAFLNFAADPRVASGGCLIESEVGTIDARLETQFRVLERALLAQSEGEVTEG